MGLRACGDVVLFDQRGTGRAVPSLAVGGRFDLPAERSIDGPEAHQRLLRVARRAVSELRARGIDPAAYTTSESAEDLEALRVALGAPQLVLWGHSYGSHLALAYLRLHPQRVARLMIGGVNGPDQRWRLPSDGDRLMARIDSALCSDPRTRGLLPGFQRTVERTLDRLAKQPLFADADGKKQLIGIAEVGAVVAIRGGDMGFVRRLPMMFAQLDSGNAAPFAREVRPTIRERPIGTAMTYLMHLASGASPARLALIRSESPRALFSDSINWPWNVPGFAAAWGVTPLPDVFREPVSSPVPALLYSGSFDGRTSWGDAEEVRRHLTHSVHILVEGAAHSPHLQSPALVDRLLEFAAGHPVRSERLAVEVEWRSPDEAWQIGELFQIAHRDGGAAAAARLRTNNATAGRHVTSNIPATAAIALLSGPKRGHDAELLLETATQLFPTSALVWERFGDVLSAQAKTEPARDAYRRAAALDPSNLRPAVRVVELGRAPNGR
jgi:pimeloyl-ACP methyl ester carboxylesterase